MLKAESVLCSRALGKEHSTFTNPNPKVRKSGAVGKAVLAQDPDFGGTKSVF